MSDKKSSPHNSGDKATRRNLPSWMSSRASGEKTKGNEQSSSRGKTKSDLDTLSFSKLLEGVVFALSGFVNPERSILRSQAQEMGAEYQPDWNSNCTLLICAFPNTPKFRQVETDCGTIVSKEWISECYSQKKLIAIETYLMHPGKPWRKGSISCEVNRDNETMSPVRKQVERSLHSNSSVPASSKGGAHSHIKECFAPTEVKRWAIDDLNETVSWLESQEETPEQTEIKKIAAEGILTCLQDAIESLEKKQDIQKVTEQWKFIPRVVKELARLEDVKSRKRFPSDKDIYQQALSCKHIYEMEFDSLDDDSAATKKKAKVGEGEKDIRKINIKSTETAYDSDETIEMTEEEIDHAYENIASKLSN